MSGGKLSIPEDHMDEFHRLYAQEIDSGTRTWTFSELRSTPVFKLFFDLDLYDKLQPSDASLDQITAVIHNTARKYYPGVTDQDTLIMIECRAPQSTVSKEGGTYVKSGIHLIFPNLLVNEEIALQIRHAAIYELESNLMQRSCAFNPWNDAIDKIYRIGCGLRLIGSVKMLVCSECKGSRQVDRTESEECKALRKSILDKRGKFVKVSPHLFEGIDLADMHSLTKPERNDPVLFSEVQRFIEMSVGVCVACFGKGRVHDTRIYMPSRVVDLTGPRVDVLDTLRESTYDAVRMTSIRAPIESELTAGYRIPVNAPRPPSVETATHFVVVAPKFNNQLLRSECASADMYKSDSDTLTKWANTGMELTSSDTVAYVQRYIRRHGGAYSDIVVKSLYALLISVDKKTALKSDDETLSDGYVKRIVARVAGVGSTFCANKGGCHASNSIYFSFGPRWYHQKCFSRKSVVRAGGKTCSQYRGQAVRVSDELRQVLFP
ncbi:unnamed protein product, partial [Phaeothamnion confervicola]